MKVIAAWLVLFSSALNAQDTLTNASVTKLVTAGISDEIILNMVKTQPSSFQVGSEQIAGLRTAGVSDTVIAAIIVRSGRPPGATTLAGGIQLQDGTVVRLALAETVTSATAKANDPVQFEVAEDVQVNGMTAIPKGAKAKGHVTLAEKAGRFGKGGRLDFTLDYITLSDGTNIRIKSSSGEHGGRQSMAALMVGLSGAFMKGKNVEVVKGTVLDVFVDGDRQVPGVTKQ
jgi:hypothetical protein